jgi:soluble lytic murein transglycosylase
METKHQGRQELKIFRQAGVWGIGLGLLSGLISGGCQDSAVRNNPAEKGLAGLILQAPAERSQRLLSLAQGQATQLQFQSRYLLAVDLLSTQPAQTLKWLQGLERVYPVMAAPIWVKRAEAEQLSHQPGATASWKLILSKFPDQPEAAQALYVLGQAEPQYWNQLLKQFPGHPRAVEVAQARLKANPNQPDLLLLLARHGLYLPQITTHLDRLSQIYAQRLTPEDWQAIAFAYWEKQAYKKAGQAYGRSPKTSLNSYRQARGLQLGGETDAARQVYQQLVKQFPLSPETSLAWLRLSRLNPNPSLAIADLDRAIATAQQTQLPQRAAEALLAKLKLWQQQGNTTAAQTTLRQLQTRYPQSEAAAELKWQTAQEAAQKGNLNLARQLATQVYQDHPQSAWGPPAAFWAGKWAGQMNLTAAQRQDFRILWQKYPQSYYAWRAATLSGWAVGDFTTLRSLQPQINFEQVQQLPLGVGSATLQELYSLGQNQLAWERWQWEFGNRVQPTLAEQLTDGLLRVGIGDYLDGIYMLENLEQRSHSEPDLGQQFQQLKQQPGYWYALYPLPFRQSVQKWSGQRQLNPLLVLSLIRQESRFQPQIRSSAGAIGLMQVMPETGTWIAQQLKLTTHNLDLVEDNLNLGTWYLDHTHNTYQNNSLMALASYNAGLGNLDQWLDQYPSQDLDRFVETIPFSETQNYVKKVLENYWNYLRLYNLETGEQLKRGQ